MSENPAERERERDEGWVGGEEERRPIRVHCKTMWNPCWYSTLDTPILPVFVNGMLTDAGKNGATHHNIPNTTIFIHV